MRLASITSVVLLMTSFAPAQRRVIPYPIPEAREWTRALEKEERATTGAPGPRYWTNFARYDLQAELEPETARLTGHAKLTYVNRSSENVSRLSIHLRQNLHKEGGIRNRTVEITGGMDVSNVTVQVGSGEAAETRTRVRGTVMTLNLGRGALEPGQVAVVEMDWSFRVPRAGRAPRMGHEDHHVFFLGYWYPQFAVLEDVAGWVADPYMGGGEFYMGYADYNLAFTVPHGWIVRATGTLENPEEVLTETVRDRIVNAALDSEVVSVLTQEEWGPGRATLESPTGKLTWRFKAENVRDCAVSTSDRYVWDATHAVVKDKMGPGKDGVCMIHAVYEPNARFWNSAAAFCRHTIEFASEKLYPYPWPHMTCCEGIIGGGMEFPMMTVIGTSFSRRGLYGVVSHETIHMWWPMIVGSNEKEWSWMDEGLTSWFESLCEGDYFESGSSVRQSLASYRSTARRGREVEAMRHSDLYPRNTNGMAYGFATYGKTAAIMHQLRFLLGENVFDKAMGTYVRRWAFKHPYPRDLFRTFNEIAEQDLDWYWRTWFYEIWTLDHGIGGVKVGPEQTRVTIKDLGLAIGPTFVQATYEDGRTEEKVVPATHWLDGEVEAVVTFGPGVSEIAIDPALKTLDINAKNNRWTAPERR